MKKLLLLGLIFLISANLFSQHILNNQSKKIKPARAAVNPEYTKYLNDKKSGKHKTVTASGHGLGYIPSPLKLDFSSYPMPKNAITDDVYDLRTAGPGGTSLVTGVRDQGQCGSCWAFATMGSLESRWKILGYGNVDLSEDNLNNCHGFTYSSCDGGNIRMSAAYFARKSGPVSEADDPYFDYPNPCPSGTHEQAYITDIRYLPKNSNVIKQAILDYGALYTDFYYDDSYFNYYDNTYYYSGTGGGNHAVTLVGWDNNKVTAGGTGAWIAKNSWGSWWGENGYFYISYNDQNINSEVGYFPLRTDYDANATVYGYDYLGANTSLGFSGPVGYGLVKFVTSADENILRIGTWVVGSNSTVDVYVYKDFNGSALSNLVGSVTSQHCDWPGYYTFDLPTAINITAGNDFYILVKYNIPGYYYPIPVEAAEGSCSNATIETGKCWISNDGTSTWLPIGTGTSYTADLGIKAYASTVCTLPAAAGVITGAATVCQGQNSVIYTVPAITKATSYIWTLPSGASGTSTTNSITVDFGSSAVSGNIIVRGHNACGNGSTATFAITVNPTLTPALSISASSNPTCPGESVTFTATGTNGGSIPSYQWKVNGVNAGLNFPTFSSSSFMDGDQVSCVMTSSEPCSSPMTATSNTITMIVGESVTPAVSISATPSTVICSGTNVAFTAIPEHGGSVPSYQWLKNGVNVGTNSETYSTASLADGDEISCVMTSGLNCASPATASSNVLTISVTPSLVPAVSIIVTPSTTVCQNTNVVFTATPVNGGTYPVYQWKKNGINVGTNNAVFSSTSLTDGDLISCAMTSGLGCANPATANSNTITMTVHPLLTPSVSISTTTTTICAGSSITFTATPINGGPSPIYQWMINYAGVGSNSPVFTTSSLANGNVVSCVLTSNAACLTAYQATSNMINMTVETPPSVTITAGGPTTFCPGGAVTLSASAGNSYLWSSGASTQNMTASAQGNYSVSVTDINGCSGIASVSVWINPNLDTWVQKCDLGFSQANGPIPRNYAVGFSIGSKGYVGTGNSGNVGGIYSDFWEYDPLADIWTQKASYGGGARTGAVGFSIGNKGYVGTGMSGNGFTNDFWEYDPAANAWTRKADFGGSSRWCAVGYSIGSKGYIGTGSNNNLTKDFWEYDPATDTWTRKADFGGAARSWATGFSNGSKGYIGTGSIGTGIYTNDFWEYDPSTNSWAQKANFGGTSRNEAVGFNIGTKGYIGTGYDGGNTNDFWQYDPSTDTWTQKINFYGMIRSAAVGFSIGSIGYLGTGCNQYRRENDFYTYNPSTNQWTQKADFGGGARSNAVGFAIGSKGYLGTGNDDGGGKYDFWEYDPATNVWTQKTWVPMATSRAVGFSIGSKGYLGTGNNNYFYEYNPSTNVWTKKANYGGSAYTGAVGFSIGSKGYIGTGYGFGGYKNDFWEYDPSTNVWTQKANFGGTAREYAVGFSIGTEGYIGTGWDGSYKNDFWGYDPSTNTWTQKANFAGTARYSAAGFSLGNKGYIGTGYSGSYQNDIWEYDPGTNLWTQKTNFGGTARQSAVGFSVGNKGYLGTGYDGFHKYDFWEYTQSCTSPVATAGSNSPVCQAAVLKLTSAGGVNYEWTGPNGFTSTVENPCIDNVTLAAAGTYAVTVTDIYGVTATATTTVVVNTLPTATAGSNSPVCTGQTLNLSSSGGTSYSWAGPNGYNNALQNPYISSVTLAASGNYTVTVSNANGCKASAITTVVVNLSPTASASSNSPVCSGSTLNLTSSGGITYNWSGPFSFTSTLQNPSITNIATTKAGTYSVTVTNQYNCTAVATTSVTVNTLPTATIGSNSPLCPGSTLSLTSAGGTTYNWSGPNGFTSSAQNPSITDVHMSVTGNYTVTVTSSNGCSVSSGISVIVDPIAKGWVQKSDFGYNGISGSLPRDGAVGFSIGTKGFIGTGCNGSTNYKDFWEYDASSNVWTQKANFGGTARSFASGFSIGNKGYIGTGNDGSYKNDFWEYDTVSNTWTQKANFGGSGRCEAVGFSIGSKGYIGTGANGLCNNDLWEYDPATDLWSQKASISNARYFAVGFSIGSKGYIGTGLTCNTAVLKDFWEYDPVANAWTQKVNFGGGIRFGASGFSLGTKGYIGTGNDNSTFKNDFWEFDPATNAWTRQGDFTGGVRGYATGFSIGNNGYIGTGYYNSVYKSDFWEFTAECTLPVVTAGSNSPVCGGGTLNLTSSTGVSYAWAGPNGFTSTVQNPSINNITIAATGTYSVTVTNSYGVAVSATTTVVINTTPPATITSGSTTTFCAGGSVDLTASAGNSYIWNTSATSQTITAGAAGNYSVTVTDGNGCTAASTPVTVTVNSLPIATITASGPTAFCAGGSVTLTSSAGSSYAWSTTETTQTITVSSSGNYAVTVTDANGCSAASTATTVTVFSSSPVSVSIAAVPSGAICSGANVTITATPTNGGTTPAYQWEINGINAGINSPVFTSNNLANGDAISCLLTSNSVCLTGDPAVISNTIVMTVNPSLPVGVNIAAVPSGSICSGSSVTFTATATNGGTTPAYQWFVNGINNGNNSTLTSSALANNDVVSCMLTSNATCATGNPATSNGISMIVLTLPTATITAGGSTTFCAGGSVTLTSNTGSTYLWSTTETTQAITVSTSGNYQVTVTDNNGCSAASTASTVTVNPNLPVSVSIAAVPSGAICSGTGVTFTATPTNGGNAPAYQWKKNGTNAGTGSVFTSASLANGDAITCLLTSNTTCPSGSPATSNTIAMNVNPLPAATITPSGSTSICTGTSVNLTAGGGNLYQWSTGSTNQTITISTAGNYSVTVTDINGCSATETITTSLISLPDTTIIVNGHIAGQILFQEHIGGSQMDMPICSNTTNNGHIVGGYTTSYGSGGKDAMVVRFDNSGQVIWSKVYGTAQDEECDYIIQTSDGGFIFTGNSNGVGYGGKDVIVVKLDSQGNIVWSKAYGGTSDESGNYIMETSTGYLIAAKYSSSGGFGANDIYVISIKKNGDFKWSKLYGGGNQDGGNALLNASDGNFIITGTSYYTSGMSYDIFLMKTDTSGNLIWFKTYGGMGADASTSICAAPNGGGYLLAGYTTSFGDGGDDIIVIKTDLSGNLSWAKTFGGTSNEGGFRIVPTASSNGYWLQGYTSSYGYGNSDAVVLKLDLSGNLIFAEDYGSSGDEGGMFAHGLHAVLDPTSDNGYFMSECTTGFGSSSDDFYIIRSDSSGNSSCNQQTISPVVKSPSLTVYMYSFGPKTVTNNMSVALTTNVISPQLNSICTNRPNYCAGDNVVLTASSGNSYLWNTGATTQTINVTTSGNYIVTITGSNGCSAVSKARTVTINPLPAATITAGGPTTFCTGGSVTLTSSAGSSYQWSTGSTNQAITVTTSGNYKVTVTSSSGCSAASTPTIVTVNPLPTATITAGGPTTFCAGGSVTLTSSAGASYLWSTGATTRSIAVATSGNYSITLTDGNGCSVISLPTIVTVNPLPTATITAGGATTFCTGGSVTLTSSAGISYQWSTGSTNQAITVTASGNYTVTVTNSNGCSAASIPTTVTVNPLPTATITAGGATTFCAGGSVVLTASTGTSYLWTTGATTQAIIALSSGNYKVIVTDANGCSAQSLPTTITVNTPPVTTITALGPTTFCADTSTTLTTNTGSSYLWSTGQTIHTITVAASGNYVVTVTYSNGCSSASMPLTITVNPLPAASITADGPTTFCQGGSVHLTVSPSTSYHWDTGATTQAITVMSTGNYKVTVTNGYGCYAVSSYIPVTVNPVPVATITASVPAILCQGGSVDLTASSGIAYQWSTSETTQTISTGTSGNYIVTVTGSNGCTAASAPFHVIVNALPTVTVTAGGPTTFCAGGSVTLTGSACASYLWSTGASTQSIIVSATGNYTLTVTSSEGCSAASAPVAVTVNPLPEVIISTQLPLNVCTDSTVVLTTGTGISYLWSTGATSHSITVTVSGNYTVTMTDGNGCSAVSPVKSITIDPVHIPSITANGPTTLCYGGSVTLTSSAAVSYLWSTGETTQSINVNVSGNYVVTITNVHGCTASSVSKNVNVQTVPVTIITPLGSTTFCADTNLMLTTNNGSSYLWSTGQTTNMITVSASGDYYVTVTYNTGCSSVSSPLTVTVNPLPAVTAVSNGPLCEGNTLNLNSSGGVSYSWTGPNGFTSALQNPSVAMITTFSAGTYTVNGMNSSGCTSNATVTVVVNALPSATAGSNSPLCPGATLNLTSSGGSSYSWAGPNGFVSLLQNPFIANATPVNSGTYTVTVTDIHRCSTSATTTVTVDDIIPPMITCPINISVNTNSGCTATGITLGSPTTSDNCSVTSVTNNYPSTTYPLGVTSVYWTVTDESGNTSTCIQKVTVLDNVPPAITCPANISTYTNDGCTATGITLGNPSTSDNCSVTSVTNNYPSTTYPLGVTSVYWTVTDESGNTSTCIQTVTVLDNVPPAITCPANISTYTNDGCTATGIILSNPSTSDNCSVASVTNNHPSTTYPLGVTSIYWAVTDESGNTSTCIQTVTVLDNVPPAITCPANISTYTNDGCTATGITLSNPSTSDNCIVASVTNNHPSATYSLGVTLVTWTVTDGSGNSSTCVQTVTVFDNVPPAITCPANISSYTNSGCTATGITLGNPSTSDNCIVASVTNNHPSAIYPLGVTSVNWTVTDGSGNTRTCIQTVTVFDNLPPAIICPANISSYTNSGCTATGITLGNPSTSDNCIVASVTNNHPSTTYPLGVTSVNWTVTDGSGNTSTCIQTVTVFDNVPPTINCSLNITVAANASGCSAIVSYSVTATDNCGTPAISYVPASGSQFSLGTTTVVATATDASGNTATCSFTVTVTNPLVVTASAFPSTLCRGSSSTLTAGGATTYSWSGGIGTGSPKTVTPTVTTAYTVTGTNSTGCTNTATVTVTIDPTVTVTASAASICKGASSVLTAAGATTYSWSNSLGTGNPKTVTATATTTYTVTGTKSGCTNTASITITVNPIPTVTASASPSTICNGTTSTLTGSGASTYTWSGGLGTGNPVVGAPTVTTTYSVTGTSSFGCSSTTSVKVTVNAKPTVTVTASPASICSGSSSTLSASGASTYSWSGGLGTGSSKTVTPATTTTYTVTGTNSAGCTNTAIIAVTVNPKPTVTVSASPSAICTGTSSTLTASGASNYSWSGGLGTGNPKTVTPTSTTSYTVTGTANGCSNTASVAVTVNPKPTITATASPSTISAGSSSTLTASGAVTYNWSNGIGTGNPKVVTPTVTTTYTVTGTDANGCSNTKTVKVTVSSKSPLSVDEGEADINDMGVLLKNYPNPFNQKTTVVFSVPEDSHVKLDVYDMTGRLIKNLFDGDAIMNQEYKFEFDGAALTPGIYIYKMTTNEDVFTGKMMLNKE